MTEKRDAREPAGSEATPGSKRYIKLPKDYWDWSEEQQREFLAGATEGMKKP